MLDQTFIAYYHNPPFARVSCVCNSVLVSLCHGNGWILPKIVNTCSKASVARMSLSSWPSTQSKRYMAVGTRGSCKSPLRVEYTD
jgi:hypothetical protein